MITIWKFPFEVQDCVKIAVPSGAKPMHVGLDPHKQPCVWCEVDTDAAPSELDVFIVGTGHPVEMGIRGAYFASFNQGPFVWHVYIRR